MNTCPDTMNTDLIWINLQELNALIVRCLCRSFKLLIVRADYCETCPSEPVQQGHEQTYGLTMRCGKCGLWIIQCAGNQICDKTATL
jgi:hypothetical protein